MVIHMGQTVQWYYLFFCWFFFSEIKNHHNLRRLEKGLYNHFSVGHMAEIKAPGQFLQLSFWRLGRQFLVYRKGGLSYAPLSVHRNNKIKDKAKHQSCTKLQNGSISQKLKQMQKNLLLGLSACHLNINSAMCSICCVLLRTKPALFQHTLTLGLKYLTAYNKDNLPGGM